MGLDSYLRKVKRVGNVTPEDIERLDDYFSWVVRSEQYRDCSLEKWSGTKIEDVNLDLVKDYITEYIHRYATWDKKKEYGFYTLFQEIAYWRKANHIHRWFVENVQDGIDECDIYEVTKEQLEELLDICIRVRDASKLEHNPDGCERLIKDPKIAMELLPTQSGFFFGGTGYDEYYLEDIRYTIKQLRKILKATDFEKEIVMYRASW